MNLNFLLLQKHFQSEDYSNFSDTLDAFIKVERLIQKNNDRLFYSDSFYDGFGLYSAICWEGYQAARGIIPSLGKREYDYLQQFFRKEFAPSNSDAFADFEKQNPILHRAALGWYNDNMPPNKFISKVENWYNVHHKYFQQNPHDNSYFAYSEAKHLSIENTLLDEKHEYLKDSPKQYIDLNDKETSPKPNVNPNWGRGFFMAENDYYFIFPNLGYSNTLKPWSLIYLTKEQWETKSDKEKALYNKEFENMTKVEIANNHAEKVANANFYTYSDDLSRYNSQNKKKTAKTTPYRIYTRGSGKHQTFLSVDFEKCTFEVYNFQGKHIGEYRLDGKRNTEADQTGKHDILIL